MNRIDSPSGRVHFSIDPYPDDEHETVMAEIPAVEVKLTAGTPEPDWCDTCMRMSAWKVPCHLIWPDGVSHIGDIFCCFQCHPYREEGQ